MSDEDKDTIYERAFQQFANVDDTLKMDKKMWDKINEGVLPHVVGFVISDVISLLRGEQKIVKPDTPPGTLMGEAWIADLLEAHYGLR